MSDKPTIPVHVGLILDGNRRWAKAKGLPTFEGHKQGYENLKTITKAAINRGVKYVSAYIFSKENWSRTPDEIKFLMDLALFLLNKDITELNKENIRVVCIGSRERLSPKLVKAIEKAEESTKNNTKGTLALCFNYGGREEVADAVKKIIDQRIARQDIDDDTLGQFVYHPEVPDVDFLIRTSGEQRLSGYMLYRISYAELYFTAKHWPDFTVNDLDEALGEYANRQRRYGA